MSSSNANLYRAQVQETVIEELQNKLVDTKWRFCKMYGGTSDNNTKPCIRINYNGHKYLQKNPLRECKNDDIIKKWGDNTMKGYQASFIFWEEKIPKYGFQISHICGRYQAPSNYSVAWSSCIENSHMIVESSLADKKRKSCHRYIRLFKSIIMKNPNSPKSGIITVENIRNASNQNWRRNVIKKCNIKGSNKKIDELINLKCECNTKRK